LNPYLTSYAPKEYLDYIEPKEATQPVTLPDGRYVTSSLVGLNSSRDVIVRDNLVYLLKIDSDTLDVTVSSSAFNCGFFFEVNWLVGEILDIGTSVQRLVLVNGKVVAR
jgi:hypothetical protein